MNFQTTQPRIQQSKINVGKKILVPVNDPKEILKIKEIQARYETKRKETGVLANESNPGDPMMKKVSFFLFLSI